MLLQVGLVLLASQGLLAEADIRATDGDTRIIGGKDAPQGFAKYQVSIRRRNRKTEWHHCGGSILNEEWVLTAAHCIEGIKMNDLSLVVGSNKLNSGGDLYTIKKMTPHEGFSRQTAKNDVGLIKINGKIAMKDNVKAIKLKKEAVAAGTKCTLTGWGYIDRNRRVPNNLQYLDFTTISNKECNQKLRDSQFTPISQKEVCGVRPNNKGMCQGDSGGPLVMTENNQVVQIGLVSWGRGCAYNFPDVFASVAGYYDWIVNNMK